MPFDSLPTIDTPLSEGAQIAHRVADYIEDHGWTKCVFSSESGEVCVLGALARLNGAPEGKTYESYEYWKGEAKALTSALGFDHLGEVITWNDSSTKEDVLSRLRATR